ncbi:arginyl tRNA synthetase-like protein [Brevibacterium sanguinis]|uniref:arginine--tRNA ligase n=2 Tax=Brevibacterium TaxID=1696 RepID=A0A366INC4_9MICO|nr:MULTISPECIES: DALR anticodon-binding domain-containing protein [Brevibacterium]RBP66335.1 arginyl tRNA synthetase-like protein [Brevibacterium sanguinis]RBP72986.1 arginyl tRNA synthetase-like protein [Brevibacterium celere]
MTPELLQTALTRALSTACGRVVDLPATVTLVRAKDPGRGHWTSNIALQTAAVLGRAPRDLAIDIAALLRAEPGVRSVEVSGPGFLTITPSAPAAQLAAAILSSASDRDAVEPAPAAEPAPASAQSGSAPSEPMPDDAVLDEVRVAHALARRIERVAVATGVARLAAAAPADAGLGEASAAGGAVEAGTDEAETALLTALVDFPRVAGDAVPARIVRHLQGLAEVFHRWVDSHPVIPTIDEDVTGVHAERLLLDRAVGVVLGDGLRLLGATAPERM